MGETLEAPPPPAGEIKRPTPGKIRTCVRLALFVALGFAIPGLMFYEKHIHIRLALRCSCATSVQNIICASCLYANVPERRQATPSHIEAVVREKLMGAGCLICPGAERARELVPRPSDDGSDCDYVYVAGMDLGAPEGLVWIYELPINHGQEGANVGLIEGNVTWMDPGEVIRLVQESNEYLDVRRRRDRW